ncbi:MAG: hypothetical protein ACP5HJ_01635 [Candidatus Micrarchaeia archaeon]
MKDKQNKKEEEKEKEFKRLRFAIYLIIFFVVLILFSNLFLRIFESKGIEKCKGIIIQTFREDCFQDLAFKTKNVSICNFTENKEKCIINIAIAQRNISLCNSVGKTCIDDIINLINPKECLKLNSTLKDYCLVKKAINENNESLCNMVENFSFREFCKTTLMFKTINYAKNFSICENLSNFSKLICLYTVARNLNTSLPQNYSFSQLNYSTFLQNISNLVPVLQNLSAISEAIKNKNLSFCSTLTRNQSTLCYILFAINSTNVSICNYLPQEQISACKQLVYYSISKK